MTPNDPYKTNWDRTPPKRDVFVLLIDRMFTPPRLDYANCHGLSANP